jgi:GNAT superfamily N-acetyltransferase
MTELLDNIFWHALVGPHAGFALGGDEARRYAAGFSPMFGFVDPARPNLAALVPFCDIGDLFYTDAWAGAVPGGWRLHLDTTMEKMIWAGGQAPDDIAPEAQALGPQHAAQALALAELTRPGPFGIRTIEMGDYFGCFEDGRLIAMAGERLRAGSLCEVSGICTHPHYQGRGLAKRLAAKVILRILQRGQTPFLHVMSSNQSAHDFYLRLGFRNYHRSAVRVISRE